MRTPGKDNSCLNTRATLEYVRRRLGTVPREMLLGIEDELEGIESPLEYLCDPSNWVSARVCRRLFENARAATGDSMAAFRIGYESVVYRQLGYVQDVLLKALGTPARALRRVREVNDRFNRTKELEIAFLSDTSAVVKLRWDRSLPLTADFCLMNRGIYSAIPTLWGLPPVELEETCCQFTGGDFCEYRVAWKNPSVWQRIRLFLERRNVLDETLAEIAHGRRLLEKKYEEVQDLTGQLQGRVQQLMSIQMASEAILSERDYDQLFPTVLGLFLDVSGYSRGMILLVDAKAGVMRYAAGVGTGSVELKKLDGVELPLERTGDLLVRTALSGKPLVVEDVQSLQLAPDDVLVRSFKPTRLLAMPLKVGSRVVGLLVADRGTWPKREAADSEYIESFANQVALAIENARLYRELKQGSLATIQALVQALEAKDSYTRGHSERVTRYSVLLAEAVGLPRETVEQIRSMCLLHDIGKIGVEERILNKAGRLEDDEFVLIRRHPEIGQAIIKPLGLLPEEEGAVRHHHERWDGQGYPDGLKGEATPVQARVISVCDAFDAMTSNRAYRGALPVAEALKRIEGDAGLQFDPKLATAFVAMARAGDLDSVMASELVGAKDGTAAA